MDQHRCPADAPSSWNFKAAAGSFVSYPTVGLSQQISQELTSKTPLPLPRCCRGSQKNDDRL